MTDITPEAKNIRRINMYLGYAFGTDSYWKVINMKTAKLLDTYKTKSVIGSGELPSTSKLELFCRAAEHLCISYRIRVLDDVYDAIMKANFIPVLALSEFRYPTGLDAVLALPLFLLDLLLHICLQKYKPIEVNGIVTEVLKHDPKLFVYHEKLDLVVYVEKHRRAP